MKLQSLKDCKDDLEKEHFLKSLKKHSYFLSEKDVAILLDHLEDPNINVHKYAADILVKSHTYMEILFPYLSQLADKTFLFRYPFFLLYLRSLIENNCFEEDYLFRIEFLHFENSIVENYLYFLHDRVWNPQFLKNAAEILLDNNAHYFWESPYDYLYKLENEKFLAENNLKLDLRLAPDKTKIFAILFSIIENQFSGEHPQISTLLEAFLTSSKESLVEYGLWKMLALNIFDDILFARLHTISHSQISPLVSLIKFSKNSSQADFISWIPQVTKTKFALVFLHIALYHQIPINYSFFSIHSQIQLENYTMWCNSKVIFSCEKDELKHIEQLLKSTEKNDIIVALYRIKTSFNPVYNKIIVKHLLKLNYDQKINTLLLSIIETHSNFIEDSVWESLHNFCDKIEDPDILLYAITILLKKYSLEVFPTLQKVCSKKLPNELMTILLECLAKLMEDKEWYSFCNEIETSLLDNIFSFADDDFLLFFIKKIGLSPFEVNLENASLFIRLERSQDHKILLGIIWFLKQKHIFNVQIKLWLFSLLEQQKLAEEIYFYILQILITIKPYISAAHFDSLVHFKCSTALIQIRRQALDAVRLDFPEIVSHLKSNNCIIPELENKIKKFSVAQIEKLIEQASHLSEELSIILYQQTPLEYLWEQKDYFLGIVTKQNFIANYARKILIRMCIETTSDSVFYQQTQKVYQALINNYSPHWQTEDLNNFIYPFFTNIEKDEQCKDNVKQLTTMQNNETNIPESKKTLLPQNMRSLNPKYKYENIKPQTLDFIIQEQKNLPEFLFEHIFSSLRNVGLLPLKMKRLWTIRDSYWNTINEKEVLITHGYIYQKNMEFYLCEFLHGADNQTINFLINDFHERNQYLFIKMNWCTEEYKTYKFRKPFTPEDTNIFFIEPRKNIFDYLLQNSPGLPIFPDHNSIIYYLITPQVYNFELHIQNGDLKRIKRIRTPRTITIGSSSLNQVTIPNDKKLSSQHCVFEFTISYIKVRKVDENASIVINDKQVRESIVEPGDKIVLGDNTILHLTISFLWPLIVATCKECGSDLKAGESYCPKCSPPTGIAYGFRGIKTERQAKTSPQNIFEQIKPPKKAPSPPKIGQSTSSDSDLYSSTIQMGGSPLRRFSGAGSVSNIFGRGAIQKPIAAEAPPPPPPQVPIPKKSIAKGKKEARKAGKAFKKIAREKLETVEKEISYPEAEDIKIIESPEELITRSGQIINRQPQWFEKWLSDDAGRPGPLERLVSKSITAMKIIQKTMGVYFVIVAHAFDSISELITTYIRNFFEIWKTYHTLKKRLQIKDSKQQIQELYKDLEKSRLYLSRVFHFSGFTPYLYKNLDSTSTFPLKIIIEVRGHLDQMKRDLVFVNAQEIQDNVKKSIIDNLKNLIPNPLDWITPFKDIFIMTFCMKYKRREIEHIYSEFLYSYNTLLVALAKQNNIEQQNVEKYFWQLHSYEEQLITSFPKEEILTIHEAIKKSRQQTQNLIQILCNCNYLINYSKWSKTDLLREIVMMKQQDEYYPGPIVELEKWIYFKGKKIFTKHHKNKINWQKDQEELLDLKKREQLAKIIHYYFY